MTIRKATESDFPFIINAITAIEKSEDGNTYSKLFGCTESEAANYLKDFFLDEENIGNELSLATYIIAEIDGKIAGCSSLINTDHEYYQNKGELFPVHLSREHLSNLAKNVVLLPDTSLVSKNRFFIEYIFTDADFRGKGIAKEMIRQLCEASRQNTLYINVLENNRDAIKYYENLGFSQFAEITIDPEQRFYPAPKKIILEGKI